jgi:HK97 family phage portal protein
MGLLRSIVNKYERGANYELGNSLSATSVSNMFGSGGSGINVLEEYSGVAWRCINIRAETLADQDLFVERQVNQQWQEDVMHEFNAILEGGNGAYDQSELLEVWSKSMDLYGESFWYFSKGLNSSKPMAVYPLDPSAMTVYVRDNKISGYLYEKNGDRIPLELDEVAYWFITNPKVPFRGMGPMQAAGWFIRSSRYVTTYVNNFLENNAIPAGVIVAKDQVDDADWKLFKELWAAKHGGIDNAGKTGFVRGDLSFVKTGMSLGEVDFEAVKQSSRDDIMAMFGVSKPIMGIYDDINRAAAVTARQLFAITITSPALKRITRKLSKKVAMWYGPQFQVGSTNPIPEDEDAKLQVYDKGVGRWFTVNEAREAYGQEPIAGGDVIDTALKATSDQVKMVGGKPKKTFKVKISTKNNAAQFSYEMKESFRSRTEGLQVKYEKKFVETTNPLLKDQKKRVIEQIKPKKVIDARFDTQQEAELMTEATIPLFISLAQEQGQLAAQFVGNKETEFVLSPVMEKYIHDSVAKAAKSFTEDTQSKIADAVATGLREGESIHTIARSIDDIYREVITQSGGDGIGGGRPSTGTDEPIDGWRAERLARTEVIKSSNEITEAAYRQSGVVDKKEWLANPGACEFCQALDGSIIGLGGTFVNEGSSLDGADGGTRLNDYEDVDHPPVHPACRCTLIPVIER